MIERAGAIWKDLDSVEVPSAPRFDPPRGGAPRASLGSAQLVTAQVPDISTMRAEATPAMSVASFPALIALADEKRDLMTKTALERDVRLVHIEDGKLEIGQVEQPS